MKNFLLRFSLAAAMTLAAIALASPAHAQQGDQDPAPATPQQQQPSSTEQTPQQQQPDAQMPPSDSNQTQDVQAFTGRVAKEKGHIVLNDPVTKVSYQFDDASKVKQYVGQQVKVTGKLDVNTNTIHVDNIEPLS